MLYENEVIMLSLGIGVYVLTIVSKPQLKCIPEYRLFLLAFRLLLPAWTLTILEGFFGGRAFNFLEHLLYALSTLTLSLWCWKITFGQKERVR